MVFPRTPCAIHPSVARAAPPDDRRRVGGSHDPGQPNGDLANHTAIVTGVNVAEHGVIYNGLPVRPGGNQALHIEPWVPKTELVEAPTVYDAAHEAGLTTAEVDWVAIYRPSTIDWFLPELPSEDGVVEREMLQAGILTQEELRTWGKAGNTMHDDVWMRAAAYIIEKHCPDLMLGRRSATRSTR